MKSPLVIAAVVGSLFVGGACSTSGELAGGAASTTSVPERSAPPERAALVNESPSTSAYEADPELELAFIESEVRRIYSNLPAADFELACNNWRAMDSYEKTAIADDFVELVLGGTLWVTEAAAGETVFNTISDTCW